MQHILIVEDNEDDYEATVRSLRKSKYSNPIHWCRNGQDALDYLRKEGKYADDESVSAPDIILLDLNMPGIDGRQLLKIIKADPKFKCIPVVVLTTSMDSRDVDSCYDLGANTYIQKPVNFEGLVQSIRKMKEFWLDVAVLPRTTEH